MTAQQKQFEIFERYLDVLLYAANATTPFTVTEIVERVVNGSRACAYKCLSVLHKEGYLTKVSTIRFEATQKTKELFGAKS
ncbi:hypothetical protein [Acinetobacter baumannii]|uniref:hypothetical protein n=1 Tax=Acinetobacter baumannii TaxID=470 RepID=UPI0026DF0A0F|nr:hypothetical protein [Acinetobacter baumannii]